MSFSVHTFADLDGDGELDMIAFFLNQEEAIRLGAATNLKNVPADPTILKTPSRKERRAMA